MALINCHGCGKKVSDKAKNCPHCGVEISGIKQAGSPSVEDGQPTMPITNEASPTYGSNDPGNGGGGGKKKLWLILVPLILIGVGVAIWVPVYQHKKAEELARIEQMRQDSIVEVARIEQLRQDSIWNNFSSPDLILFGLHGHVSTLENSNQKYLFDLLQGNKIEFDESGTWINYSSIKVAHSNNSKISSIKRNSDGYITSINYIDDGARLKMTIIWDTEKLSKMVLEGYEWGGDLKLKFDEGTVAQSTLHMESFDCYTDYITDWSSYETDSIGNWIESNQQCYEKEGCYGESSKQSGKTDKTVRRKISYFQRSIE